MRKLILAAAVAAFAMSSTAKADGLFPIGAGGAQPRHTIFSGLANAHPQNSPCYGFLCHKQSTSAVPVFMAAPWYLYWPYDGHFQTPAPPFGGGYGSGGHPGFGYGNPYFMPQYPAYMPGSPVNPYPMSMNPSVR